MNRSQMDDQLEQIYDKLHENIAVRTARDFKELVNFSKNISLPVHNWFDIKEGYSRDLVVRIFERFGIEAGDIVIDPFNGSGTTLLTAKEMGIDAIGFEVNPFLAHLSKVKLTDYRNDVEQLYQIHKKVSDIDKESDAPIPIPELSISKKLFRDQLDNVLKIRHNIDKIEDEKICDFFFVCFLTILQDASAAIKDGGGLKYPENKHPKNFVRMFKKKANRMITDIERTPKIQKNISNYTRPSLPKHKTKNAEIYLFHEDSRVIPHIVNGEYNWDKTDMLRNVPISRLAELEETISLAVFSPPYANTFDYSEVYKVELWFGNFVNKYNDLKDLRNRSLTSHMNKHIGNGNSENTFVSFFTELLEQRREMLWNRRIPAMLGGYFNDMRSVLAGLYRLLKKHAYCVIVVGNSSYANIAIPTDAILGQIGLDIGYDRCDIEIARHLGTSSQQHNKVNRPDILRESLVILKKRADSMRYLDEKKKKTTKMHPIKTEPLKQNFLDSYT